MNSPMPRKNDPHSATIAVAAGGGPPYDGYMEERIEKLETTLAVMKLDIEIIKATGATKSDLAELSGELKAMIAEAKASTIMWVTTAIFLAQLLPSLIKLLTQ
jgi:hypothetical protein